MPSPIGFDMSEMKQLGSGVNLRRRKLVATCRMGCLLGIMRCAWIGMSLEASGQIVRPQQRRNFQTQAKKERHLDLKF
eukprot:1916935-Amphidinium_carterae.1